MDPQHTWPRRDRIPVNPVNGAPPSDTTQTPDLIAGSYRPDGPGSEAPYVIRKGPMVSLAELGNIFDPAQVDDFGEAPLAGSPKSRFCSGGGRTLRIGQPEFHAIVPLGADRLATIVEQHRPYCRLSDLQVLTPALTDAFTYTPRLSENVPGSSPPVADVFDRAREEAFGKVIGHCVVQSRTFRLFVLGEALDRYEKRTGRALMEAIVRISPDATGQLHPSLHDVRWHCPIDGRLPLHSSS